MLARNSAGLPLNMVLFFFFPLCSLFSAVILNIQHVFLSKCLVLCTYVGISGFLYALYLKKSARGNGGKEIIKVLWRGRLIGGSCNVKKGLTKRKYLWISASPWRGIPYLRIIYIAASFTYIEQSKRPSLEHCGEPHNTGWTSDLNT